MNELYDILNYDYIQKQKQQYEASQNLQVLDTVKKLKDLLASIDEVAPEYRQAMNTACCAVLLEYLDNHNTNK